MKILWTLGGAVLGRAILGKWGMMVGGGLGYWLAPEEKTGQRAEAAAAGAGGSEAQERYPEEAIIDAMAEGEDPAETARRQEEISG